MLADVIVDGVALIEEWALALAVVAEVELVDEDVVTALLRGGEAKALLAVEPFDRRGVLRVPVLFVRLAESKRNRKI